MIGNIAVPVVILSVVLQRIGIIDPSAMAASILLAALLGCIAVALGGVAFARLWVRGGVGFKSASWGVICGMLSIAPIAALFVIYQIAPPFQDLATNPADPPEIEGSAGSAAPSLEAVLLSYLVQTNKNVGEVDEQAKLQKQYYPDIVPRRYRIPPARLHTAVYEAAKEVGWRLSSEVPPDLQDDATRLQLVSRSPVFGFSADVAVRIRPDPVGALIDVRASSRTLFPDFTGNAGRIRKLLARVDAVLLATYGDLEQVSVLEEEAGEDLFKADDPEQDALPVPGFKPYFEGEDTIEPEQDLQSEELAG